MFIATYFTNMNSTNYGLIDSGCSNHMTRNKSLFIEWCEITHQRLGKGTIDIPTYHGTKLITDVLYVSDID